MGGGDVVVEQASATGVAPMHHMWQILAMVTVAPAAERREALTSPIPSSNFPSAHFLDFVSFPRRSCLINERLLLAFQRLFIRLSSIPASARRLQHAYPLDIKAPDHSRIA